MKRAFLVFALLLPGAAFAEGLEHSTEFVMRRDGAWIANFVILATGLGYVIYRFLIPALRKRSEDLAEAMAGAEKLKKEAEARLAELDAKMREFEAETRKVQQDAREQGEALKAKIIAEAETAAKRILKKAQDEIESERAKATGRLKKEAVEMAMETATGLLEKNFNEADHRKAMTEYVARVGEGK
ncbi:MAG: ATP synthase F0 subunit B [Nitrospinae bacterium]|nr:ATP synthase F0 subunit B [Nitrospinota bacterium]